MKIIQEGKIVYLNFKLEKNAFKKNICNLELDKCQASHFEIKP